MPAFVYLLVLLSIIMVITQHLLPKFPGADHVLWTGLAVVCVKFEVDWIKVVVNSHKRLEGVS